MDSEIPVLIVGGGPVGLALAGDLGWRGIPCLLVEQSDGAIVQPRMDLVGIRTMEFCRRWGLVGAVELVDQQHRRAGNVGLKRLQQRPLDQVTVGEDVGR